MKRASGCTGLTSTAGVSSRLGGHLGLAGIAILLLAVVTTSVTARVRDGVPVSLQDVGEYAEHVYDAARAQDWKTAAVDLAKLKTAARRLPRESVASPSHAKLRAVVMALERAVQSRDKMATLRQANQVTLLAADLTEPYHPTVPAGVIRLDYLGRELEIWAETQNLARLQTTAGDLARTWESVRPDVEQLGATALSKEFSDLVTRVGSARSADDYALLAPRVLEAVDHLESVFRK